MAVTVPTYRAAQVREAERPLLDAGAPLMARAAAALARVAEEELADAAEPRVLVLAGSGDNGGDALYAAAELIAAAPVDVLTVGSRVHEGALSAALAAGSRRISLDQAVGEASAYRVVLDGILGIGAAVRSGLRGDAREAVSRLLPLARPESLTVIAVDLPSGLDPDTGEAVGSVLPAAVTVTFGAVKTGIATGSGPALCGRVVLVDLGLGDGLASSRPVGEASVSRVVTG